MLVKCRKFFGEADETFDVAFEGIQHYQIAAGILQMMAGPDKAIALNIADFAFITIEKEVADEPEPEEDNTTVN